MNLLLQDGGTAKPMNDLSLAVKLATFSPSNCMLSILPSNSPSFKMQWGQISLSMAIFNFLTGVISADSILANDEWR